MSSAGSAPVGVNQVTAATRARDVMIVIVIPFVIPALVLPLANGAASLTLTNLAFGFVAVAVAGVVRAITQKTDEWLFFVLIAVVCVSIETALAVKGDTADAYSHLKGSVLTETARPASASLSVMRDNALAVAGVEPSTFHWICATVLGAALIVVSFTLIRREK